MPTLSSRITYLICCLLCFFLVFAALFIEHRYALQPCSLCILQRIILGVLGLVFLVATIHRPKTWGVRIYALLTFILSGLGVAAAYRQIWLQTQPPQSGQLCIPGMGNALTLNHLPSLTALKEMYKGSSDCGQVLWSFLGLSMAEWTLIFFILLGLFSLVQLIKGRTLSY